MSGAQKLLVLSIALTCLVSPTSIVSQSSQPHFKNPLGLAVDAAGEHAYVAYQTAGALAVVELRTGKVLWEIGVGRGTCDLALVGRDVFVVNEDSDEIVHVDCEQAIIVKRWRTEQAPRGVAIHPEGRLLFVACHDARVLQAIDVGTGQSTTLPLEGWPERVLIHRDTQVPYLLILGADERGAVVHLASADSKPRILATNRLPGVSNARGLASKQGASSFVALVHQQPRDQVPATQVAQGWVFTNAITTFSPWGIDTPTPEKGTGPLESRVPSPFRAPSKVLDEPGRAYADPSDVVLAPDHRHAFVACAGADAVLALRTDRFVSANYGPLANVGEDGPHPKGRDDLALSRRYVVARIPTGANPRRLALSGDGGTLAVSNTLGDSLTVIDARTFQVRRTIALGEGQPDAARRGEVLFHSSRMTFQGQFSCASCHPRGGSDGLNWDLSRDGLGNFLNTRSLRGARDTAPYGWHGASPTLADRIAGTMRTVHRHEPSASDVDDLAAYLGTLAPPRPLPAAQPEATARGKLLFEGKAKCSACHQGLTLSDVLSHDVGTKIDGDVVERFDTPSLRGVARTAPYLHHGGAKSLDEVFTKFNAQKRHGAAHLLTPGEVTDLIAYVKGL
jgi:DNA-binding beta-propeller fold protein YncE